MTLQDECKHRRKESVFDKHILRGTICLDCGKEFA